MSAPASTWLGLLQDIDPFAFAGLGIGDPAHLLLLCLDLLCDMCVVCPP